jgi:hypothetical protein
VTEFIFTLSHKATKNTKAYTSLLLLAMLKDTTTIYACIIILLIAPIVFWTIPGITSRTASSRTTEGASGTAGHIATIIVCCATDAVITVDGVVWIFAYPFLFLCPDIAYRVEVGCQYIPDVTGTDRYEP